MREILISIINFFLTLIDGFHKTTTGNLTSHFRIIRLAISLEYIIAWSNDRWIKPSVWHASAKIKFVHVF